MTNVYSVSQINRYIKGLIKDDVLLSSVFVRGELSNAKYHPSGHFYFSLKDKCGMISCVMFQTYARNLRERFRDGDTVTVSGTIDVYEAGGRYQLYAKAIRKEGAGELYERFLRLKAELEEMGMFDARYKKPVPRYARRIGVVTADTGAAVRDIEQIARRRNPYVQLILYPAKVQGSGAAESIAEGIRVLNGMDLDVLIVGRGGGSAEDLMAFNEEIVARAIFESRIPVISAVGHETDTTIADFVADLRAPTPSAAAELAVFDYRAFRKDLEDMKMRLARPLAAELARFREMQKHAGSILRLRSPERMIADGRMKCDALYDRMENAMLRRLSGERGELSDYEKRLTEDMQRSLSQRKENLSVLAARLHGLSPLLRLMQGFSYTSDQNSRAVRSVEQVRKGDPLTIYVTDGKIAASVTETEKLPLPNTRAAEYGE